MNLRSHRLLSLPQTISTAWRSALQAAADILIVGRGSAGGALLLSTSVVQPESVGVKLSRAIAYASSFAPFLAGELLRGDAVYEVAA